MKPVKPKFAVGQMVTKISGAIPPSHETVSIIEQRWAGHCHYYLIKDPRGATVWVLETQLSPPLEAAMSMTDRVQP
jgi:hypothetical protein